MLVALHTQTKDVFRAIEKIGQEGTHGGYTREIGWSESRGVGYLILEAATARRSERSYIHHGNPFLDLCAHICSHVYRDVCLVPAWQFRDGLIVIALALE